MALIVKRFGRNIFIQLITKPAKVSLGNGFPVRVIASGICYQNSNHYRPLLDESPKDPVLGLVRQYSSGVKNDKKPENEIPKIEKQLEDEAKKPTLFQRFKQMYRDYWYVLVPVHIATSAVWLGCFYYAVRSGVDVLAILEWIGINEKLIAPLRDSSAGYVALTFALYKIASPLRYTVTLGGTTFAIKKLTSIGWIKPVPSTERIKEMLQEQKGNLQDRFKESKAHYKTQMTEKRSHMLDEMRRYKTEMRNLKNKVKKM